MVFWAFRIMVGLGLLMAAVGVGAPGCAARNRLYTSMWLRRAMLLLAPSGFIALLAGWTVTEVGRQPFTVYGLLRTADSASPIDTPALPPPWPPFVVVYAIVFGAGSFFLFRVSRRPPTTGEPGPRSGCPSARPESLRRRLGRQP